VTWNDRHRLITEAPWCPSAATKDVNERDSRDVKTIHPRIESHIVRGILPRGEQYGNDLSRIRIKHDHSGRAAAVNRADIEAMPLPIAAGGVGYAEQQTERAAHYPCSPKRLTNKVAMIDNWTGGDRLARTAIAWLWCP